jgi:hypothetical protein
MSADPLKARDLFLHAVGRLPPEEWDGYVAAACGEDAEMERHVGRLLQVHRAAGSFLDRPALAVAGPPEPARTTGPPAASCPSGPARSSAPTGCWSKSGRAGSGSPSWPSSSTRSAARWR